MGGFEPVAKPWGMDGIPEDFKFSLLPEDWEHFRLLMEQACIRIPSLETAPVRQHVNGPESFTPDNRYMLGEAPELRNFYVAAGFNSVGIASAAGAGQALAEWVVGGEPSIDLWDVDIRRFMPFQGNARYLRERTARSGRAPLRDALAVPPAGDRAQHALLGLARSPRGPRRRLRRGRRLGAGQLVRDRRRRAALRLHLRASELVPLRRRRAPRGARGRRPLRPVVAGQVPVPGTGRRGDAAAPVRQRRRRATGADRVHADAQPPGRHRVRPDGDAPGRRCVHDRHDRRRRHPRRRLDPPRHRRQPGHAHRRDVVAHRPRRDGPALARAPVASHARRSVQRGVPVRHRARDRDRLSARAGHADHLRRRARLGALHPHGVRVRHLRGSCRRRLGSRSPPRRLPRDGLAPDGEGLPLLGPRHRQRRHPTRGGPDLRRLLQEAHLHGTRRAPPPARQAPPPAPRDVHPRRPRAAPPRRRAHLARRRSRRTGDVRRLRSHTRSLGGHGLRRPPRRRRRRVRADGALGAGDRDASASGPPRSSSRRTIPPPRGCARRQGARFPHERRVQGEAPRGRHGHGTASRPQEILRARERPAALRQRAVRQGRRALRLD